MSRLSRHKQKEFIKKIAFFTAAGLSLIILILTLGFKLLISTSLFINHLAGSKNQSNNTNNSQENENFYGLLDVNSIPSATNSAQIVVSGNVTNYDTIEFYLNDQKVKTTPLLSSDNFSEEIGDLKKGNNQIYVKAIAKQSKNTKTSPTYTVLYKDQKPKLDISEPNDNTTTTKEEIKIAGKTDNDTFIKINDYPIVVDADGSFQYNLRLKDGDNSITITAQDNAGNIEAKSLKVTYQKD